MRPFLDWKLLPAEQNFLGTALSMAKKRQGQRSSDDPDSAVKLSRVIDQCIGAFQMVPSAVGAHSTIPGLRDFVILNSERRGLQCILFRFETYRKLVVPTQRRFHPTGALISRVARSLYPEIFLD